MPKRILVGLGDADHSVTAVRQAIDLCKRHGAELTAVTVIDHRGLEDVGPIPIGGGPAAHELRKHRHQLTREIIEKAVAHCEAECQAAKITFRLIYEEGNPLDTFCHTARYQDLMILSNEDNLFDHGVIEEPSDELIRLVHEGVQPMLALPKETSKIERVLIAYSGSMESARTMKQFITMRLWPEAKICIATFELEEKQARDALAGASDYCRAHSLDVETHYAPEPAQKNLLPLVDQWGADLIVVGNSARSLLMRKLFGETALHVMRHADRAIFMAQ
jgi:nucleotide-binding universal stress UspA family protein